MSTPKAQSFARNYEQLRQNVETLRELDVSELDRMVTLVDEASQAYQKCKARIEAVRGLLAERLDHLEAPATPGDLPENP